MTLPLAVGEAAGSRDIFIRYVIVLPEPGAVEMNLTLGSSCPTYQPLSMNRLPWPLTTLMGSVHRSPPSLLTVW